MSDAPSKPRFWAPKLKIQRAKRHLNELNAAIQAFMQQRPYELIEDFDPQTGTCQVKVGVQHDVPDCLGPMAGDVVHNIRSALDVLAVELARENLKPGNELSRSAIADTYFPISASKEVFERTGVAKIKRLSEAAQKIFIDLKPYQGGNDALYKLHQLDILDKHVILVPVGAAILDSSIGIEAPADKGDFSVSATIKFGAPKYPLKNGDVLATFSDIQAQPHAGATFTIAFGEGRIVDGEPVIQTLGQFGTIVEAIIARCEQLPEKAVSSGRS